MNKNDLDFDEFEGDEQEGSFLKKNWLALTVGTLVLAGGTSAAIALSGKGGMGTRKAQDMTIVQLVPPPPPPVLPPPPPPPPMAQEEEKEVVAEDEQPEENPAEDTGPTTSITGGGPDSFGLRSGKGGIRRMLGGARSPASMWAPYAGQAASRIAAAMRNHSKLKYSTMTIKAQVWIDSTGRVTRATTDPTGDPAVDAALRNEVLNGLQLSGPPPEGMKMPVNLKVTARRPS